MLLSVYGFPSSDANVQFKIIGIAGNTQQDWSNTGVTERVVVAGTSVYVVNMTQLGEAFQGFVVWKSSDAVPYTAVDALNMRTPLFVTNFPTGKTVWYKLLNENGSLVSTADVAAPNDTWTSTGVNEVIISPAAEADVSFYYVSNAIVNGEFQGFVFWRSSDGTLSAADTINTKTIPTTSSDYTAVKNDILRGAYKKVGAIREGGVLKPTQILDGDRILNDIVKSLQAEHIFLWTVEWAQQTLTASHEVTGTDAKIYTCRRSGIATVDNKPITGKNYTAMWEQTGTTGGTYIVGASYKAIGDITLSSDIVDIEAAFIRDGKDDVPLRIIRMKDYFDVGDKFATGKPSYIVFERSITPRFTIYSQPDKTTYVIHYLKVRKLHDFDDNSSTLDFPAKWIQFLKYAVTYELGDTYGMNELKLRRIRDDRDLLLKKLKADDSEFESESFVTSAFSIRGYRNREDDYGG